MKKFLIQLVVYSLIVALLFNADPIRLIITQEYKKLVAGIEVYHSIEKSKKKRQKKTKVLILGDSVGRQLFNNYGYNDSINSLASNQAISMVGQYLLLKNYLEVGNSVEKVILIYAPFSFRNNLNQVYTFHYFLKPFYSFKNMKLFTETVNKQIRKIPHFYYSKLPHILTTNWAPNYTNETSLNYYFLAPISVEYLNKIKELSLQYNFEFILLPTPTRESNFTTIEKMRDTQQEINATSLTLEFDSFFNNIVFINDSCFKDNVHLKHPEKFTPLYERAILNMDKNDNQVRLDLFF